MKKIITNIFYKKINVWEKINPILKATEVGVEEETKKIKRGDGFTKWLDLEYAVGEYDTCSEKPDSCLNVVLVPQGIKKLEVGYLKDMNNYYVVNDDLNTCTFFLISKPVKDTVIFIRNDGFGLVQVQGLNDVVINTPGTLVLRGNGAMISLIAVREQTQDSPAVWDLVGDVLPIGIDLEDPL